jgi:threonine synthase
LSYQGLIQRYRPYLPVSDRTPVVTLLEGDTPLIEAKRLAAAIGLREARLFLKYEGLNPTGSFKDRGMTMAVSKAVEEGCRAIITASTGNTSAAAAAYAARAGIRCIVLIPDGMIALGKLSQALIHGAQVFAVRGNFDAALSIVKEVAQSRPVKIVNSINPFRIEGQKTAAFEVVDVLGEAPSYHFIPVGNACNICAYWKGYREYQTAGKSKRLPRMMGFQAEGAAPIVKGQVVPNPETIATAIRIGNPQSWKLAEATRDESGGAIDSVTDREILEAYGMLSRLEGVFCEPASAAGVAGLKKWVAAGKLTWEGKDPVVVCTLTGHGLKDPERALAESSKPIAVDASPQAVLQLMDFKD